MTRSVASATQAPSRIPPLVSIAGYQPSAEVERVYGVLYPGIDGVPEGEPHPGSPARLGESWVAPAVSQRTSTFGVSGSAGWSGWGRHGGGRDANAWPGR